MKSLMGDILRVLKEIEYTVEIPEDNITNVYSVIMPDFKEPYIYVSEINNSVHERTYTHKEEYSDLSYQIEIYSRQQKIDDVITPSDDVVRLIAQDVDNALSNVLGLLRIASPVNMPYGYDSTVRRYILTYNAILDLTHDYIYRR